MNDCLDEGALRAYLDRESPADEMTRIAVHLGACAECHASYNQLAGRAARVTALMESLQVGNLSPAPPARRLTLPRRKPVVAGILALAATATLAFVLIPRRISAPAPVASPRTAPRTVSPAIEQANTPTAKPPAPAAARVRNPKRLKPPDVQYYLALDDEPIDTGVVMRVALDGSGVQADVIFDAEGRPRAIRAVK